jgi:hypothetical protein
MGLIMEKNQKMAVVDLPGKRKESLKNSQKKNKVFLKKNYY